MRAPWARVSLGELLALRRESVAVEASGIYPNFGIYSFGRGVFGKPSIHGDSTSATTLFRARAGQIIYSKLFAFEGAFAVVPEAMGGHFISNEYPTFDVDEDVAIVEFIRLAITRPAAWAEMAGMTVGMGHRRQRLKPEAFLEFEIDLPPLNEQRAIVFAAERAKEVVSGLHDEVASLEALRASAREARLGALDDVVPLSDVILGIDGGIGAIPKCEDRPPEPGEWGIVKVSAVRPGRFFPAEAKTLPAKIAVPDRAKIRAGDILVTRCSGSKRLVGAACRVPHDPERLILTDFVLRIRPDESKVDPAFLVEALATRSVREQIEGDIERSTTLRSVSKSRLRALEIPVADIEKQRAIAAELRWVQTLEGRVSVEFELAEATRDSLLAALLSGERRIPERLAA
jgi:type I restriction enzyme S subunit